MATYLDLCKSLHREAGMAGTGPVSVTTATGDYELLADWIRKAWAKIQVKRPDWRFNWADYLFISVSGKQTYSAVEIGYPDLLDWGSRVQAHETRIPLTAWRDFDAVFPEPLPAFPTAASVNDAGELVFRPTPNDVFFVKGRYRRAPQLLTENADVPRMPAAYHDLIVYEALLSYARYEAAAEIPGDAERQRNELLGALLRDQLPTPCFGAPQV